MLLIKINSPVAIITSNKQHVSIMNKRPIDQIIANTIPEKSKFRYEKAWDDFVNYASFLFIISKKKL